MSTDMELIALVPSEDPPTESPRKSRSLASRSSMPTGLALTPASSAASNGLPTTQAPIPCSPCPSAVPTQAQSTPLFAPLSTRASPSSSQLATMTMMPRTILPPQSQPLSLSVRSILAITVLHSPTMALSLTSSLLVLMF